MKQSYIDKQLEKKRVKTAKTKQRLENTLQKAKLKIGLTEIEETALNSFTKEERGILQKEIEQQKAKKELVISKIKNIIIWIGDGLLNITKSILNYLLGEDKKKKKIRAKSKQK